jgi:hypothetical protein
MRGSAHPHARAAAAGGRHAKGVAASGAHARAPHLAVQHVQGAPQRLGQCVRGRCHPWGRRGVAIGPLRPRTTSSAREARGSACGAHGRFPRGQRHPVGTSKRPGGAMAEKGMSARRAASGHRGSDMWCSQPTGDFDAAIGPRSPHSRGRVPAPAAGDAGRSGRSMPQAGLAFSVWIQEQHLKGRAGPGGHVDSGRAPSRCTDHTVRGAHADVAHVPAAPTRQRRARCR